MLILVLVIWDYIDVSVSMTSTVFPFDNYLYNCGLYMSMFIVKAGSMPGCMMKWSENVILFFPCYCIKRQEFKHLPFQLC